MAATATTATEAIAQAVHDICGSHWTTGVVYGSDLETYLATENAVSPLVVVVVGPIEPVRDPSESGRFRGWRDSFSIYMHIDVQKHEHAEIHRTFKRLIRELNGKQFLDADDDDKPKRLRIGTGIPEIAQGFASPQLFLTAQ